jgi:hypothetical protein
LSFLNLFSSTIVIRKSSCSMRIISNCCIREMVRFSRWSQVFLLYYWKINLNLFVIDIFIIFTNVRISISLLIFFLIRFLRHLTVIYCNLETLSIDRIVIDWIINNKLRFFWKFCWLRTYYLGFSNWIWLHYCYWIRAW